MGGRSLLVWCGGNVAEYYPVTYIINGRDVRSFLTASALYVVYRPDYLLVLVPEILFVRDHCVQYRKLVVAKAGAEVDGVRHRLYVCRRRKDGSEGWEDATVSDCSPEVYEFVSKLVCDKYASVVVVPHPGSGDALDLKSEQAVENGTVVEKVFVYRQKKDAGKVSVAHMLNFMYYHIVNIVEKKSIDRIIVDLTHGTNIMVQLLLIVSAFIRYGLEREVQLWTAPAIGREIEFQDLTPVVDNMQSLIRSIEGLKLLDDRLVDVKHVEDIGRYVGRVLGPVYGNVKSAMKTLRESFWLVRSGQCAQVVKKIPELRQVLVRIRQDYDKLVENYIHGTLSQELRESDTVWLPLVHAVQRRCAEFLEQVQGAEPLETMIRLVENLLKFENYLPALLILRELVILTLLAPDRVAQVRVKGPEWEEIENILLTHESAQKRAEKLLDVLKNLRQFVTKNELEELIKRFDSIVELRNKLAHGMLPKDSVIHLYSYTQWLNVNYLDKRDIGELIANTLKQLKSLYEKYINYRKSLLDQLRNMLTEEELKLIEELHKESRKTE